MSIQGYGEHMRERGDEGGDSFHSIPVGALWSALTSEYAEFTANLASIAAAAQTDLETATMTVEVSIPVSTVTVQSTILETAYVTTHLTTGLVQPAPSSSISIATLAASTSSSSGLTTASPSTQTPHTQPTPPVLNSSSRSHSSHNQQTTLPAVITDSGDSDPLTGSLTLSLKTHQPAHTPTAAATAASAILPRITQKHAIVGGLSGAIVGLVFAGLVLFYCLRKRRLRRDDDDDSKNLQDSVFGEKGIRPTIKRKWTELTGKGTPKPTPQLSRGSPVTVDEEHHIIRMSTQHWMRPYAVGQGVGYRESLPPGLLRVTNPDLSRPTTPRMSSDTAGSFLKKQRSALAAVLLSANRSRASSRSNVGGGTPPQIPEITFDPALSRECVAPTAVTPSFRSYPSATSLHTVQQQPPDDPFLTPPDERDEPTPLEKPKRPLLAPVQSATDMAQRTLSHVGNALHSFRSKSGVAVSVRSMSRHSVSTFSSRPTQRDTTYSDPFDLDKPSIRESAGLSPPRTIDDAERGVTPHWRVFDGT